MFLATASHELKTPLTVIQGFSQLLNEAKESSESERKVALEAMESRARQLNKIVDRLLLSSRIEAGRARVAPEQIDLRPLLVERCETLAGAVAREIVPELDEDLPTAHADRQAVITIVDHLLDNALKYSPDGRPINVKATADDRCIWITVVDNGIGMDIGDAEKCFEKFWQAESSDIRRFGGTGIGLYIVRSLVEAMGGEVAVASVLGQGSAFTFSVVREDASWEPGTSAIIGAPRPGVGDPSVIREFMRQIGVPGRKTR
jgi:signal transduction histidine kinase